MSDKILEVSDLQIRYVTDEETVRAVNGVSFTLERGESIGLVGETGAGKTTTALGIMGLVPDPPGEIVGGSILFEDQDLLKLPEKQMREIRGGKISMIFQDPMTSLNPVMTVGRRSPRWCCCTTKFPRPRPGSGPRRCWSRWVSPAAGAMTIPTSSPAA